MFSYYFVRFLTVMVGAFEVTRQFELNVRVPDVALTGLAGGAGFSGSLGALVSSTFVRKKSRKILYSVN